MRIRAGKPLRILDFDLENRPLSYLGMGFTTDEITAIGCSWVGTDHVDVWLLGQHKPRTMLREFVKRYMEADIVTGHYIRRHDLPILNGSLLEHGLPVLPPKLTSDTKMDLVRRKGISASQENLSEMFGLDAEKQHMSQVRWRSANRLTKAGLEATRGRVTSDVVQHKQLRERLILAGALGAPKLWVSV